ncbi:putative Zn-dependent peptidase [Clostridium sp. CAG:465]|nr:putative Zn-dependent peptidase [Clostridium sp. CAG:465]
MNNIYKINSEKFKSIYFSINFTMPVNKRQISENALLSAVLGKSNKKFKTQKEIQMYLYSLYGANFDIGIEKFGDLYNIEFRGECINKKYLPNNTDVVNEVLEFLYDAIYNPNVLNGAFDEEVVEREKDFILNKIREVKDDKLRYGIRKMEELMCKDEPFSTYVYGDEDDIYKITSSDLYKRYNEVISNSCITFIISGNLLGYEDIEEKVKNIFNNKLVSKLNYKELIYNQKLNHNQEVVEESQQTTQSVLSYGLRINNPNSNDFYKLSVYNALLGGTPSSKLFQNFREKESLAYTVRSRYYRFKDIIIIYAGIQKENYEKAKLVLENEINKIKDGEISDEEFEASKKSIISDLKEWNDSKIALSKMFISNLFSLKNDSLTLEQMVDKFEKVTKQDIIDIASKITIEKIYFLGGENNA